MPFLTSHKNNSQKTPLENNEELTLSKEKKSSSSVSISQELQNFITNTSNDDGSIHWLYTTLDTTKTLDIFLESNALSISEQFSPFVKKDDFNVFSCDNQMFGLQLTEKPFLEGGGPSYDQYLFLLDNWIVGTPQDIWFLFYNHPKEKLNKENIITTSHSPEYIYDESNQLLYKELTFQNQNGEAKTLYYGMINYYIVMSTSLECLKNVSHSLFASD
jgi:hypothetical protein